MVCSPPIFLTLAPASPAGALYFVKMDADGGMAKYDGNKAGAKLGTGYCDAQCPHDLKFINGEPNVDGWKPSATDPNAGVGKYGTCCAEMDIWESNSISTAYTAHACSVTEQTRCEGVQCGDNGGDRFKGVCDKNGCDIQPYRLGNTSFFGPGASFMLDTTKPMTVTTQFITDDGTDGGKLVEIRRSYVQDGKTVETPAVQVGAKRYDSISHDFCAAEKELFKDGTNFLDKGGMGSIDDMNEGGMVLVMSLWDDHYANMLWLDSTYPTDTPTAPGAKRGTCSTDSGKPADVESQHADAYVKYSNIRYGELGSTAGGAPPSPSPGPSPSPSPPVPAGCPAGSLKGCIDLCPSTPAAAYQACVQSCVGRCSPTTKALAAGEEETCAAPWAVCSGCCANGFECVARNGGVSHCAPTPTLLEAFAHTQPTKADAEAFLAKGTTRFSAAGLAPYAAAKGEAPARAAAA